jgi:hypothetical protein
MGLTTGSTAMITGFNTDVQHKNQVYHVQTEDRGTKENPVVESLVYVGGTIIAKKLTPYGDKLEQGANEASIASLLKRQHQIIIAAIKAGRIDDLIKHSSKPQPEAQIEESYVAVTPEVKVVPQRNSGSLKKRSSGSLKGKAPAAAIITAAEVPAPQPTAKTLRRPSGPLKTGSLNLDEVISDYLKRSSEQEKLELKVISPGVFVAGKSIVLRIEVRKSDKLEPDSIVTVKVIGTAFKPQVYIGRAGADAVATFNLTLPAFSAGTAAIVIEAQSRYGRGELKHLIRRA